MVQINFCGNAPKPTNLFVSSTPKRFYPIRFSDIPENCLGDIVYYNPVIKQKRNDDGSTKFRVRGTAGGDRSTVPYDVSARTASLETVKLLIHSVVSSNKK